jgi:putative transposase
MKRTRFEAPGEVRFLTFSCWHSLPILQSDWAKDEVVDQLSYLKASEKLEVFAYCVMPNHVHILLRTDPLSLPVPKMLSNLKARSSRKILIKLRQSFYPLEGSEAMAVRESRVWQRGGGYDRNIHSGEEFLEKARYVEDNPVKAGLCKSAEEYRWSSAGSVILPRDPW